MKKRIGVLVTAAALCLVAGCVYKSEEREGPERETRYVERAPDRERVDVHVDNPPPVDVHVHDYR
jgi:hypothetical protein